METNEIMKDIFGVTETVEDAAPEGFSVKDIQTANWCMRKYKDAQDKIKEADQARKEIIERVKAWLEDYCREYFDTMAKMEELLKPWIEKELETSRKRSIPLIHGKAGFRKGRDSIDIHNMDALVEYAKKNDIPVKTVESVLKKDLLAKIKETGQVPDPKIAFMVEAKDNFYIDIEEITPAKK